MRRPTGRTLTPADEEFAELAGEFVRLIETRRRRSPLTLLARAHRLLPRLYASALELRPLSDSTDPPVTVRSCDAWKALYIDLSSSLGALGRYLEVYDPYQLRDVPVETSLADDFCDIYQDLKTGLCLWEGGFKAAAINSWRTLFRFHWAEHATGAIRALGWLELQHNMTVCPPEPEKVGKRKPSNFRVRHK